MKLTYQMAVLCGILVPAAPFLYYPEYINDVNYLDKVFIYLF